MICLILNDTNVEKDIETEFRLLVLLKKTINFVKHALYKGARALFPFV